MLKQKIQGSLKSVDATIKDIDKERAFRQAKYDREYELAKGDVSDEYIKSHFANDARLRKRRADLLEKRAQDSRVAKDIEIVQKRLLTARERWGEKDLEHCIVCH